MKSLFINGIYLKFVLVFFFFNSHKIFMNKLG